MPRKGRGGKRKRVCQFCVDKIAVVDYKESNRLTKYLSERGKILPRRISGNCAGHQRQVTVAIKRSRQVALLPYSME
jgi:small subunit ribosomal protein S18